MLYVSMILMCGVKSTITLHQLVHEDVRMITDLLNSSHPRLSVINDDDDIELKGGILVAELKLQNWTEQQFSSVRRLRTRLNRAYLSDVTVTDIFQSFAYRTAIWTINRGTFRQIDCSTNWTITL